MHHDTTWTNEILIDICHFDIIKAIKNLLVCAAGLNLTLDN